MTRYVIFFLIILTCLIINKYKFYDYAYSCETYRNNIETITKNIIKTQIKIPTNHKWSNDFKYRFINHELQTNIKLKNLMMKLVNKNVIDTGGHVGDTGLFLAKFLKDHNKFDCKIIIIEPDKTKVDFIKEVTKLNRLNNFVEIHRYAVGAVYGKGKIIKKSSGYLGGAGAWTISECNNKDCDIEIISLDSKFKDRNIGLIHLDVEGFEYKVLLGSKSIIKNNKPDIILEITHSDITNIKIFFNNKNYKQIGRQFQNDVQYSYTK